MVRRRLGGDDRGQAYTLEGVVSAILVVTALLVSLQTVVLTPTTAGTVDQDVKGQLRDETSDLLVSAASDDELTHMALFMNESGARHEWFAYADSNTTGYTGRPPCTTDAGDPRGPCGRFGAALNDTLASQGFTYNLVLAYETDDDPTTKPAEVRVVHRGVPSSNAVTASFTVALYDDMRLTGPEGGSKTLAELDEPGGPGFYAPDIAPGRPLYTVVEVRITAW